MSKVFFLNEKISSESPKFLLSVDLFVIRVFKNSAVLNASHTTHLLHLHL